MEEKWIHTFPLQIAGEFDIHLLDSNSNETKNFFADKGTSTSDNKMFKVYVLDSFSDFYKIREVALLYISLELSCLHSENVSNSIPRTHLRSREQQALISESLEIFIISLNGSEIWNTCKISYLHESKLNVLITKCSKANSFQCICCFDFPWP